MDVLLVERRSDRLPLLADRLGDAGCRVVARVGDAVALGEALERHGADIVVLDLAHSYPGLVAQAGALGRRHDRPVAVFVDETDPAAIQDAVRAGISAYVVRGAQVDRLRDALEVASARYAEERAVRTELDAIRTSLTARKRIEQAKGRLMRKEGLDEQTAYDTMRRIAMRANRKLADVADAILEEDDA